MRCLTYAKVGVQLVAVEIADMIAYNIKYVIIESVISL